MASDLVVGLGMVLVDVFRHQEYCMIKWVVREEDARHTIQDDINKIGNFPYGIREYWIYR